MIGALLRRYRQYRQGKDSELRARWFRKWLLEISGHCPICLSRDMKDHAAHTLSCLPRKRIDELDRFNQWANSGQWMELSKACDFQPLEDDFTWTLIKCPQGGTYLVTFLDYYEPMWKRQPMGQRVLLPDEAKTLERMVDLEWSFTLPARP